MLTLLSPAKSLDLESPLPTRKHTQPRLLEQSEQPVSYTHLDVYKRQGTNSLP